MVLADNSNQTTVRHSTRELARNEAKRLGGLNPGVKFFVLRSEGHAVKMDPVAWEDHDVIPF